MWNAVHTPRPYRHRRDAVSERPGPTGGDLGDVEKLDTVLVAVDPTFADAFAADYVQRDPMGIPNVEYAAKISYGNAVYEERAH